MPVKNGSVDFGHTLITVRSKLFSYFTLNRYTGMKRFADLTKLLKRSEVNDFSGINLNRYTSMKRFADFDLFSIPYLFSFDFF